MNYHKLSELRSRFPPSSDENTAQMRTLPRKHLDFSMLDPKLRAQLIYAWIPNPQKLR